MRASALTWTHYPRCATALMAISIPITPPCEYSIRHDGQNNRLDLASDRIRPRKDKTQRKSSRPEKLCVCVGGRQ